MNFTCVKQIGLLLILSFIPSWAIAQNNTARKLANDFDFTQKGSHWIDLNMGVSFSNSDFGSFEDPFLLANENRRNFGLLFQPKFQVFIKDALSVGFHMGFALDEFKNRQIFLQQNRNDYFAGLQTEYYILNVKNAFYISSEVEVGIHYFENKFIPSTLDINNSYTTYFQSGIHLNLKFALDENWVIYAKFFDLITYTTSEQNFFGYGKGVQFNNSLNNFINFPQFGMMWKLF